MGARTVRNTCSSCDGSGKTWSSERCSSCDGKGWVSGIFGGEKVCSRCDGDGNISRHNVTCSSCNGKGYSVSVEEESEQPRRNRRGEYVWDRDDD